MLNFARASLARPGSVTINPWSYQSLGTTMLNAVVVAPTSQNYIAVSQVTYVPFWIPEATTFTKMFWLNGSAVAGAYDVGIYGTDGTRLVSSGSVSAAGANAVQTADITDTTCARGTYYMAIVSDTSGITQKIFASLPAAGIAQSFGLLQQASVTIPLSTNASPATFAKYASAFIPLFGVQGYRAIGS